MSRIQGNRVRISGSSLWLLLIFLFIAGVFSVTARGQSDRYPPYPDWLSGLSNYTVGVALGDVDGDGDLDLVCANRLHPNTLYLNRGERFESEPVWSTQTEIETQSVALGDIDGDGDLDLVCGNYMLNNHLYLNAGGTFEANPAWQSGPAVSTQSVVLGDVDNDGDLDLVCGNRDQRNTLYLNVDGMLDTLPAWSSQQQNDTRSVALGDIDGDGDLDLVCGNSGTASSLYLNSGGSFSTVPDWVSGQVDYTRSVVLGDMDGDGDLDLVCGNFSVNGTSNTLYLNNGSVFSAVPTWFSQADKTQDISLGDVDGDGDLDLVCCNYGESRSSLYLNSAGVLDSLPVWESADTRNSNCAVLGDIDGDGMLDLVIGNDRQSNMLYLNSGATLEPFNSWTRTTADVTTAVVLGDVNGDNMLDMVCANRLQSSALYLNDGSTLASTPAWESVQTYSIGDAALEDIDGDGDLDLVCAVMARPNMLYLNTGGTFGIAPDWESDQENLTTSVALGDVDGDGDLDIVYGNALSGNTLYLNAGGTIESTPVWQEEEGFKTLDVVLGDIDGDGDLDLACANDGQGNRLYRNSGGTFEDIPAWESEPMNNTTSVALGDIDGDGDLDLVCGNSNQRNTLYRNTGGTFTAVPAWESVQVNTTQSVKLEDLDGDGDLDLICGNDRQGNTIYLNSTGIFQSDPVWTGQEGRTYGIALGDLDSDGDLDLVSGNLNQINTINRGMRTPVFKSDPLVPSEHLANNGAHLRSVHADRSTPGMVRFTFSAVDLESDPVWLVAEYQYEGIPVWHPVTFIGRDGAAGPFATSPAGVVDSVEWDTHLLPFDARSVNLRFRVAEIPKRVSMIQHAAPYVTALGRVIPFRPVISAAQQVSFPAVTLGDTVTATLAVENRGTADLTIGGLDLPTTEMRLASALPVHIVPGGTARLAIEIIPETENNIEGGLVLYSDDPFAPAVVVDVAAHVRPLAFTIASLYPDGEIDQGSAPLVSITMEDSVRVDSTLVFYRNGGAASFASQRLERVDHRVNEQYFGSIPAGVVGARGLEYFVTVFNDRFSQMGSLQRLRTRVDNLPFTAPPPERYAMVSIPLEMEGTILGVLSDDLGGIDNTQWRLWAYNNSASAYIELPNDTLSRFQLGRGYWLIVRDDAAIDTGPAEGLSTPTDTPFEITLSPGWNSIGMPFAFPVVWDSVLVDSLSVAEALGQGVIEPLWGWSSVSGGYVGNVSVLEPFEAYWVRNVTDPPRPVVLRVPPREELAAEFMARRSSGTAEPAGWQLTVGVRCDDLRADHNALGVRSEGSIYFDPYDRSEPPMSPGRSLSLYFPHFEWEERAGRYAVDIRPMAGNNLAGAQLPGGLAFENDRGHAWTFDIAKNFSTGAAGDEVVLEFSGIEKIPADVELLLVDRTLERMIDLRAEPSYRFFQGERAYVAGENETRFMLLAGGEAFVESFDHEIPGLPGETVLHQNHPNPFNPSTLIRYDVAAAGRVRLAVYDVSGALVKVLEDRHRDPGRYEAGWDGLNQRGEPVSSGVYFYVLEAPGVRLAKKMLCVK